MGDLQRMHNRVAARTRPGSGGLPERFKRRLEAKARRQAAEEEAALKAALAQQQINAQRERDKLLQDFQVAKYESASKHFRRPGAAGLRVSLAAG
jgi:hypothetical protein